MRYIFYLLFFLLLGQAQAQAPTFSLFLIGDAGEPEIAPADSLADPVLRTLAAQLKAARPHSGVVFLGDNVYPRGLVGPEDPGRAVAEARLVAQLAVAKNHPGLALMIPGNHDWAQGGREGWANVQNQEKFVREYLDRDYVFWPKGGCPTPHEVVVRPDLVLLLLDTQWHLHPWDKPGETSDCEAKDLAGMLAAVDDALYRHRGKTVVVLGHHPMYSYGHHGGHFTLANHLLPLNELGVPLPLPGLGSLYPLYRSLIGNIQDTPNPTYAAMRKGLVALLRQYRNAVYVNGHDHNLQWIVRDSVHYITSGAGCKSVPVGRGRHARFTSPQKGFARLDVLANGSLRLAFIDGQGQVLHQGEIDLPAARQTPADAAGLADGPLPDSLPKVPNPRFGGAANWLWGRNYRTQWTTPINAKVLDLDSLSLKITQQGGGMQTRSLRYQAPDGRQFVTRSVEKYPASAVPAYLRSQAVVDVVDDQVSASHPYAALAVPTLARAAGVLHTQPQLVVLPQAQLPGLYQRRYGDQLALFEERPDGQFQGAKKVYSTAKVREKLAEDNQNAVDQAEVLRARLFDMWIGDWDRHEDQWRWAGYDQGKGLQFRPIPRDRDQAFFVNQGLVPVVASRNWIVPKIQGFDFRIRDVRTFNFNARYFDRLFLTQPGPAEWEAMARELQQRLTDAAIDTALAQLPRPDPALPTLAAKLRQRRADLPSYALAYHRFLAREVDVLGSDKDEIVWVDRLPNGHTQVRLYDQRKDGSPGRLLYARMFDPAHTREVRVWGLDGRDQFTVHGRATSAIRLRLVGGAGKDQFTDTSQVAQGAPTLVYDRKKGTELRLGPAARDRTRRGKKAQPEFDPHAFKYDRLAPMLSVAYNPDDGIFAGAGIDWTLQGFGKAPFAARHRLAANYAVATQAYQVRYQGNFADVVGRADLELRANYQDDGLVDNFFGLDNGSVFDKARGISFYRVKMSLYEHRLLLKHQVGRAVFHLGPAHTAYRANYNPGRFIAQFAPPEADIYRTQHFLGGQAGLAVDTRDQKLLTTKGLQWQTTLLAQSGLGLANQQRYVNLATDLVLYHTLRLPARFTLRARVGGATNLADYAFYQANTLGGTTNLRGYRRSRFAGKDAFYNQMELSTKLLDINTYLFPAALGLVVFHDVGRVWNPTDTDTAWHRGYGAGLWFAPFRAAYLQVVAGRSTEGWYPHFTTGLNF
jgi:hypothetical protein